MAALRDPTIELPVKAELGPNVYVSVLAVRGRLREVPWYSFFQWGWKTPGEWWGQWRGDGQVYQAPTAMVDLSKPAFKYGIAEIAVAVEANTPVVPCGWKPLMNRFIVAPLPMRVAIS